MLKTIRIFDPKEKPFGSLSNNYPYSMEINKKSWKSVTNYVYANILRTPIYKLALRDEKVRNVKKAFSELYLQEDKDIIKQALEKSLENKFNQDTEISKKMKEILINTGNSPLIYVSNDVILGTGPRNNGYNLYGNYLMQIRHNLLTSYNQLKKNEEKSKFEELYYNSYLSEKALQHSIRDGNDLIEFFGKTHTEILNIVGRELIFKISPTKENVIELYEKNLLDPIIKDAINSPDLLVQYVRKNELRNLRLRQKIKQREIIFDMYADYLIEKNYPEIREIDYVKAKEQQFKTLGYQQKIELEKRLYNLYKDGMLSERLSKNIDEQLIKIKIPRKKDVDEAEKINLKYNIIKQQEPTPQNVIEKKPILVYPSPNPQMEEIYNVLSPFYYSGEMIFINGRSFPTVIHYIMTSLLSYIPNIGSIKNAYPYILANPNKAVEGIESFLNPDIVSKKYENERDTNYADQLRQYCTEGLNEKFKNREFQNLLLSTENATIIWNDFENPILGIGSNKNGENFCGKYLVKLRTKFREERKNENLKDITNEDITALLYSDAFMYNWLKMKVKDMCTILNIMYDYFKSKNKEVKLTLEFAQNVIDDIYKPCAYIFQMSDEYNLTTPGYFKLLVQNENKMEETLPEDVVNIIWKRITVMIYFLIKFLKESNTQNIRTALSKIEFLTSKKENNCLPTVFNNYNDCIFSAIINTLKNISSINNKLSKNNIIDILDFDATLSIILNQKMKLLEDNFIDEEEPSYEPLDPEDAEEIEKLYQEALIEAILESGIEVTEKYEKSLRKIIENKYFQNKI